MDDADVRRGLADLARTVPTNPSLLEEVRSGIGRRRRHRVVGTTVGLIAIVAVAAGASALTRDQAPMKVATDNGHTDDLRPLPTSDWEPGGGQLTHHAAVYGVLKGDASVDGGCVWLTGLTDSQHVKPVVWPKGYRVRFAERIEIVAPDGTVVARDEERVGFGGQGASPVPKGMRCMLGQDQAAYVETDLRVEAPGRSSGDSTDSDELTMSVEPTPVTHGQEAQIRITGTARGGRYLHSANLDFGDGTGSSTSAGCAADADDDAPIQDDSVALTYPATWRQPGTYRLTATLSAGCGPKDVESHVLQLEVIVE